jgi:ATP-binding cassette subfamily C protein CydC
MPLPSVLQRAGELAAAARRLFGLIDAAPAVAEPREPVAAPAAPPAGGLGISARSLRFRYAPDTPWIFDGVSFDVPPGGRLGISGPSGVGKSTLVSLLMRFREYEGSIRLTGPRGSPGDGQEVASVELRSMAAEDAVRQFSVVPQSPFLFHSTIRENLELAMPQGAADPAAIFDALEIAQLSGFVRSLPAGLETEVGEHGREMSAGEVRRLAVARALLREAPIYVLDEPSEGLDERTADQLMAALDARLRGRTLLVISHRERDFAVVDEVVRLGRPVGVHE